MFVHASVVFDSVRPYRLQPTWFAVHGISQARILEWVAISFSRGSSRPRNRTLVSCISCIVRWFFTTSTTWEAQESCETGLCPQPGLYQSLPCLQQSAEHQGASKAQKWPKHPTVHPQPTTTALGGPTCSIFALHVEVSWLALGTQLLWLISISPAQ